MTAIDGSLAASYCQEKRRSTRNIHVASCRVARNVFHERVSHSVGHKRLSREMENRLEETRCIRRGDDARNFFRATLYNATRFRGSWPPSAIDTADRSARIYSCTPCICSNAWTCVRCISCCTRSIVFVRISLGNRVVTTFLFFSFLFLYFFFFFFFLSAPGAASCVSPKIENSRYGQPRRTWRMETIDLTSCCSPGIADEIIGSFKICKRTASRSGVELHRRWWKIRIRDGYTGLPCDSPNFEFRSSTVCRSYFSTRTSAIFYFLAGSKIRIYSLSFFRYYVY